MSGRNFTLKPEPISEHQEQVDLFDKISRNLERYPVLEKLFAVPNGGWRGMKAGAAMRAEGVKAGVPDLCLPHARGGYWGLYLEMKVVNASPSDTKAHQRTWHHWLREEGYYVEVCKGCTAAWARLLWYLSLPATQALRPDVPSRAERLSPPG